MSLPLLLFVSVLAAGEPAATSQAGAAPAVVFVVRHAEAGDTHDGDPGLTEDGQRRARALAELLARAGVTRLYSTELRRTQETLAPLAERLGLEVTSVPGRATDEQIRLLRELPPGSVAVVAGHSNTVPALVRGLGGSLAEVKATDYDRLFAIVLGPQPAAIELRYGP